MALRLITGLVLALVLVSCGGGDGDSSESGANAPQSTNEASDDTADSSEADDGDTGVANVDLASLGAPPDAAPQTAVAVVDGTTYTFDAAELGSARCEIGGDSVAINIGQSQDWFAFVAKASDGTWSIGPSFGLEDGPQFEGLTAASRIEVVGERVTFQGEIVIKVDATDFDSWTRTIGSLTANCEAG